MAAPTITSINPTSASPGQKVIITGTGFTTATAVKFGGFDALLFEIKSSTIIWAYAPIQGTGTITVENPDGNATVSGFFAVLTRIRLPDLPDLARPIDDADQIYVWDAITNTLRRSTVDQLPVPGIPDPGNIYTMLGSPFKVRVNNDNHSYDEETNSTTVTDLRLLGKDDYVVSATDVSNEFENTRLTYNALAGSVTISDYKLSDDSHITIYADGVVTAEFNNYITKLKSQILTLQKATAPFLPSLNTEGTMAAPGGIIAWFRPAIEIPDGWTEYLPGRGRSLIGQDTTGELSAPVGTAGGTVGGGTVLTENNIPKIQLKIFSNGAMGDYLDRNANTAASWTSYRALGNQDYDIRQAAGVANFGLTSSFGQATPDPIEVGLSPYRIVNFICSTITP